MGLYFDFASYQIRVPSIITIGASFCRLRAMNPQDQPKKHKAKLKPGTPKPIAGPTSPTPTPDQVVKLEKDSNQEPKQET